MGHRRPSPDLRHRAPRSVVAIIGLVVVAVLATLFAIPGSRPEPAAALVSDLPPPCAEIVFASGISCNNPDLFPIDPGLKITSPEEPGLVALETRWTYFGFIPPPPSGIPFAFSVCILSLPIIGCVISIPFAGTVWPFAVPDGLDVDFGSPNEDGDERYSIGTYSFFDPPIFRHEYEQKGFHAIQNRTYWRAYAFGILTSPLPIPFFIRSPQVNFITVDSEPYQVDESRGTLIE
jgi:hypothetical protein